jgi:hypothetical protein
MAGLNPGFRYTPLDPAVDGIRLLVIKPGERKDFECTLQHVTFSERPEYEALSYTWGNTLLASTFPIVVDQMPFLVHENLFTALLELRRPTLARYLWIDAICINQDDIAERNQQVRIMPHIYSRAKSVLVWLGKFPTEDPSESSLWTTKFLEDMCCREYWKRVWIIQEIGKARRIYILVNGKRIDWNSFISAVKEIPKLAESEPVKLANGLLDKYGDGHRLHTLLSEHSQAMCTDLRDKIYGFIGLAIDCDSRFPIGYDKSRYEMWTDAVIYQSRNPMAQKFRIIEFACLVNRLLSGLGSGTTKGNLAPQREANVAIDESGEVIEYIYRLDINHKSSIMIPARVSGIIAHLGPTCEEIVSKLEKLDEWTSSIQYYCPTSYLRKTYEENDRYLNLVEKMQGPDLEVHSFGIKVAHPLDSTSMDSLDVSHYWEIPSAKQAPENMKGDADSNVTTKNRLFIMNPGNYGRSRSSATIGRAPPAAKVGDFICHFFAMSRAVVVRRNGDFCQVVGTAVLGQDEILYNHDNSEPEPGQTCVNIYLHLLNLYINMT